MVFIDEAKIRKHLFRPEDEIEFKRKFAIQWLAAIEAVNYQQNCHRGWKGHRPPVEDAHSLAELAWNEWKETNGLAPTIGCFIDHAPKVDQGGKGSPTP